MKKRFIYILLLCSLFFNIAHATVIALEEECHHDSVSEYLLNTYVDDDCGDLCELHHMFHFMAILSTPDITFDNLEPREVQILQSTYYTPPFKQTNIKPPIA